MWYSMLGSIIKYEIDQEAEMSEANVLAIDYSPEVCFGLCNKLPTNLKPRLAHCWP